MTYLAAGLIAIWAAGLLVLLGRALNLSRQALNNPASDKPYWNDKDYLRFYFPLSLRRRSIFEYAVVSFFPHFRWRKGVFGLAVNPAKLTKAGRQHQKRALQAEWIAVTWAAIGIIPVVWACYYLMAP